MKKTKLAICVGTAAALLFAAAPQLQAQGHWEFNGHYGRWSLNLLSSLLEDPLEEAVENEIRDTILEELQADHPTLQETSWSQTLDFKSNGDNFGFGVRWYPGGHDSSFSLGLSVEKSTFKILPTADVDMGLYDTAADENGTFTGSASVDAIIKALSFHVNLRWDILPSKVVHPYFHFGVGASTAKVFDNSTFSYDYSGQVVVPGEYTEDYSDSEEKTLRELIDEEDVDISMNFMPILEIGLGLKAKISQNFHILVDAGIFNGFIIRGGLALRL